MCVLVSSKNVASDRASDSARTQKMWVQFSEATGQWSTILLLWIEENSMQNSDDSLSPHSSAHTFIYSSHKYWLGVYYLPGTICKMFLIRREIFNWTEILTKLVLVLFFKWMDIFNHGSLFLISQEPLAIHLTWLKCCDQWVGPHNLIALHKASPTWVFFVRSWQILREKPGTQGPGARPWKSPFLGGNRGIQISLRKSSQ